MTDQTELTFENAEFERQPLRNYAEKAYLDYSMYVVLDRALPHIGDGLKPVQRRIIYAMSELGLSATSKPKKSARTVGDVIGKFHPHGDSACYEALVLMAQPFSYRYPLVEGQGNFGSPDDPKSFAAMRYTESKLAPYAKSLLAEVDQGTVQWAPNFDGTLNEPKILPARLPNLLLNGTTGIAVGMATDVPPHNMKEVASALLRLLDKPDATLAEVMRHIKAPDFPTGCEIISPREDLMAMYRNGSGSVKMRGVYQMEDDHIIVTALPYQVSPAKILEQIAAQMQAKKLPMVADIRDESDHENPIRLVISPRSNRVDIDELMGHLFATTDLEKNARVNLNVIGLDGRPGVKNLLELLSQWLVFRRRVVTDRLEYRLDKVVDRLHVLEGLLVAFLNIDQVIAIIRHEDEPKAELMAQFDLTGTQAEAILNLRLRHLAKLEEVKIRGEQEELDGERKYLEGVLGSGDRLTDLLREEISQDAETWGDARRCKLVERESASALSESALITSEPVTVILSTHGLARAAKGHEIDATGLNFKSGDEFQDFARGRSNQQVVFLDSTGRSYATGAHQLPSARSLGDPLTTHFTPPQGAAFAGVLLGEGDRQAVLATDAGYGFVTTLGDLQTRQKAGKQALTVPRGAQVLPPRVVNDVKNDLIACVSTDGYLVAYPVSELPQLAKGKGNKMMGLSPSHLKKGIRLAGFAVVPPDANLLIHCGQRFKRLNASELADYAGERTHRGTRLPRGYQNVDRMKLERD